MTNHLFHRSTDLCSINVDSYFSFSLCLSPFFSFFYSFYLTALLEPSVLTVDVRALTDCVVLYLSHARFSSFLRFKPEVFSPEKFVTLVQKRTATSLKALPIFAPLKLKTKNALQQFDEVRLSSTQLSST